MANFQLDKGSKFSLDKGIRRVRLGLGWDAGDNFDLDASVFGLVHLGSATGKPQFYNDGSHAVCYANKDLKTPEGHFATKDGSIVHSGDNRTGAGDGDDEVITIDFTKVPDGMVEIAVWVTIYEAAKRNQNFGMVKNSYIKITDADTGGDLCIYRLKDEFGAAEAVQVGSFTKGTSGSWEFTAVGAGAAVELGAILQQYS